jgi:hypothetical protein
MEASAAAKTEPTPEPEAPVQVFNDDSGAPLGAPQPDGSGVDSEPNPPAAEPESEAKSRTYIVLIKDDETAVWTEVGRFKCRKPEEAFRAAAEQEVAEGGKATFAAVPERSWNPTLVGVEVKRSISVSVG